MPFDTTKNKHAVAAAVADITTATGTPAAGTVDVTASHSQSELNNNFATQNAKINAILAALRSAGILSN